MPDFWHFRENNVSDVVLRLLCCFKLARIALHVRQFGDRFFPLAGVTRVKQLRIKSGLQSKPFESVTVSPFDRCF